MWLSLRPPLYQSKAAYCEARGVDLGVEPFYRILLAGDGWSLHGEAAGAGSALKGARGRGRGASWLDAAQNGATFHLVVDVAPHLRALLEVDHG